MHQGAAVNAKEAIRKLREAGFEEKRHTGSHKHFEHPDFGFSVPVPMRKESHGNG